MKLSLGSGAIFTKVDHLLFVKPLEANLVPRWQFVRSKREGDGGGCVVRLDKSDVLFHLVLNAFHENSI